MQIPSRSKAMRSRMKMCVAAAFIVSFAASCDSSFKNGTEQELANKPTEEIGVIVSGVTIKIDFRLDMNMRGAIASENIHPDILKIKTRRELIDYYKALPPGFQPGYSSISDNSAFSFTKVEYLLAQECFQDDCGSLARKEVLKAAIDKQKHKFGVEYTAPSTARRTGVFLIAVILLKENDDSFLKALAGSADLQKSLQCLNNDMWMDDEGFNSLLIQYAERFLSE